MVTIFGDGDSSPEDHVIGQIDPMDLHHGPYSQDPAWMRVEVYGTALTAKLKHEFVQFGCDRFEEFEGGFAAMRPRPRLP